VYGALWDSKFPYRRQWRQTVDFSKFKPSDWLKAGGGLVMLIAYFLDWWSLDVSGFGVGGAFTGSDFFFTGTVPWILLVLIGVLTVLAVLDVFKLPATFPAPLVFLAASVLSLLLILIRFTGPGHDIPDALEDEFSRSAGLYLALLAAIAVVAGCVMGFKESGGNLNDLKDMNKIKGQFGGGGGGTPPPPPPGGGYSPPPPPPPGGTPPPPPPPV